MPCWRRENYVLLQLSVDDYVFATYWLMAYSDAVGKCHFVIVLGILIAWKVLGIVACMDHGCLQDVLGNFVGNPALYSDGVLELCWIDVFGGAKEWTMILAGGPGGCSDNLEIWAQMKVVVAVKRVVDYAVKVRVKPDKSGVETSNVKMSMNPFCEIALEEALRIRENGGASEVVAVSIGPTHTDLRLNQPRYATLPNIMKAKSKVIKKLTVEELNVELKSDCEVCQVTEPPVRKAGTIVSTVDELIDKLKNEAHVL
ncbi:Electron transfer flavoprotein subunit beta, mitochondrial [Dendrobium catenatum]|uniref:Electron transfer flavoprotein subunit beta, mitochondrial n=1 Tax=Dendrobium catenatum TaxID=906689 RepID=A0A2I0XB94_9ASPA|nr:Electron transfer flavoprotein subunit beta, mitochondrial [Dendrobium catenatum]